MPQEDAADVAARLLLVVDHDGLRREVGRLLQHHVSPLVVSEAVDRSEAVQLAQLRPFAVIIVDLALAHADAMRLAIELQRLNPSAALILLSRLGDEQLTAADVPLKSVSIVPRESIATRLPAAVVRVLAAQRSS